MANISPLSETSSATVSGRSGHDGGGLAAKADLGIGRLSGNAHKAVDRVAGSLSSVAHQLGAGSDRLMATQKRWRTASRTMVASHPLATVAVALAAGALLGSLVKRRTLPGNDEPL